ncbi:hypothetical protein ACN2XU_13050 [Primorskyibacter sp. 2E107]|uniref:hypothetical protein n=1 Tax=Primorskyibacter sp. 2E107 TaxID=3403458 RepID=UPI003AF54CD9
MSFFEPDPVLLWFLFFKKFVYLEVLALLSFTRILQERGPSRWLALIALILALAGVATVFAPAAGLNDGAVYVRAEALLRHGGGLIALLVPSAFLVLSGALKTARARWIDVLHGLLVLTLLGFAWYAA